MAQETLSCAILQIYLRSGSIQVNALSEASFGIIVFLGSSNIDKIPLLNMVGCMDTITREKIEFEGK